MQFTYKHIFKYLLLVIIFFSIFISCSSKKKLQPFIYETDINIYNKFIDTQMIAFPKTRFAVLSDTHIYDTNLGITGKAFEDYIKNDILMIKDSTKIVYEAVRNISQEDDVNFIIISGGLTKDGQLISHNNFKNSLMRLKRLGKKIYIIPGDTDINNTHSFKYIDDNTEKVETISPEKFTNLYADFGFNEALYKDTNSLSYIVEPVQGLWLFALDTSIYKDNDKNNVAQSKGYFTQETITWIENMLIKSYEENKSVIAMMHHGITEDFNKESKNFPDNIIENFAYINKMFAFYNVRAVFTGHSHANNITYTWTEDAKFLYDIQTGSLISYPFPYRKVALDKYKIDIKTYNINSISPYQSNFIEYSMSYTKTNINNISKNIMKKYKLGSNEIQILLPYMNNALLAYYKGDENSKFENIFPKVGEIGLKDSLFSNDIKDIILSLWQDIPPSDNNIIIDLSKPTN